MILKSVINGYFIKLPFHQKGVLGFVLVLSIFIIPVISSIAQSELRLKGKQLAESYCGFCHAFPSPSLLPKQIWKKQVLPQMAAMMGFKEAQDSLGVWDKTLEEISVLQSLGTYPTSSMLGKEDFQLIEEFYEQDSPVSLPNQLPKGIPIPLEGFEVKKLFIEGIKSPKTSLVAINEERGELLISDGITNQLYAKDRQDELFTLPAIGSPAVQFIQKAPQVYGFISIGSIAPSDLSQGGLYEMDLNTNTWNLVLEQLPRPVYGVWEDLYNDGKADFLLCNYGNHGGGIWIYWDGDMTSKPTKLGGAGARKVEVVDLDKDGHLDIVALFCQGNERISAFYNLGNGQFGLEQTLLRFSPVMGASYFELQDFNGDGDLDLLLSNGDNWDYSSVLKPYHGFRIYENNGRGEFEEVWFYPQYGAAKAMAVDVDQDGDLDIATIAFYDELDDPMQQFILFENQGNWNFQPKVIPEAVLGKWLTMDVGDLDQDGDQDIVLGAYAHNVLEYTKLLIQGLSEIPNVLILENSN